MYEPLRRLDGANVGLEDAELPPILAWVHPLGHRPHDLELHIPGRGRHLGLRQRLTGHRCPAAGEVPGNVRHRGALDPGGDVVPAERGTSRVRRRVQPVARQRGQIDAPDEGDPVVDHHGLLVVAVQGPFVGVERDVDGRGRGSQLLRGAGRVPSRRGEHGRRRPRPEQDSHVDPRGQVGEQVAQHHRRIAVPQDEVRRHVPARHVDVAAGGGQLLEQRVEQLLAVDEDVQPVAEPRRCGVLGPAAGRSLERVLAEVPEPAGMVRADRIGDAHADLVVEPVDSSWQGQHVEGHMHRRGDGANAAPQARQSIRSITQACAGSRSATAAPSCGRRASAPTSTERRRP